MIKTAEEIKTLYGDLGGHYDKMYKNFDIVEDFYMQDIQLEDILEDIPLYIPPTARAIIDTAVDHIMALGHIVRVLLWSESEQEKKLAGQLEEFGRAVIYDMDKNYRINVRRSCIKNGILYGMFALKQLYIPRLLGDKRDNEEDETYETRKGEFNQTFSKTFPFYFSSVHPKNIRIDPSNPSKFVFESYPRRIASIKDTWPDFKSDQGDNATVQWMEYWSEEQRMYFVDNEPLKADYGEENPFGLIPYQVGYGGFGLETSDATPEDLVVSIIAPILDVIKSDIRIKTALMNLLEYQAYDRPTVTETPGTDFKLGRIAGEVSVIPEKYGFKNMESSKASPDVWRALGLTDADIQQVMPKTIQGSYPKGVTSGYMGALSVGQARLKLEGIKSAWETAVSNILDNTLYMVKYIVDEPVGIVGGIGNQRSMITIRPSQLKPETQKYIVTLEMETPEDKDRRQSLGIQLLALPEERSLSWETIIREYFDKNPQVELENIMIMKGLRHPAIAQAMALRAMQAAGMTEELAAIESGQPVAKELEESSQSTETSAEKDYMRTQMRDTGEGALNSPFEEGVLNYDNQR